MKKQIASPLVSENQTTTSLLVARKFKKRHKHILQSINDWIAAEPEFSRTVFRPREYKVRGKFYPCYEMTEAGFSFIAMKFTGPSVVEWQIKFMTAFETLRQQPSLPHTLTDVPPYLTRPRAWETVDEYLCLSLTNILVDYGFRIGARVGNSALHALGILSEVRIEKKVYQVINPEWDYLGYNKKMMKGTRPMWYCRQSKLLLSLIVGQLKQFSIPTATVIPFPTKSGQKQ